MRLGDLFYSDALAALSPLWQALARHRSFDAAQLGLSVSNFDAASA